MGSEVLYTVVAPAIGILGVIVGGAVYIWKKRADVQAVQDTGPMDIVKGQLAAWEREAVAARQETARIYEGAFRECAESNKNLAVVLAQLDGTLTTLRESLTGMDESSRERAAKMYEKLDDLRVGMARLEVGGIHRINGEAH